MSLCRENCFNDLFLICLFLFKNNQEQRKLEFSMKIIRGINVGKKNIKTSNRNNKLKWQYYRVQVLKKLEVRLKK